MKWNLKNYLVFCWLVSWFKQINEEKENFKIRSKKNEISNCKYSKGIKFKLNLKKLKIILLLLRTKSKKWKLTRN